MSEYRAKISYMRIAPRKARLVADLVRNTKNVDDALYYLRYSTKRSSTPIRKLLISAISNAQQQDSSLTNENLYIKSITVDEGVKLKRFRPASRGNVKPIDKKTSHINIILEKIEKKASKNTQSQPTETKEKQTEQPKEDKKEEVKDKEEIETKNTEKGQDKKEQNTKEVKSNQEKDQESNTKEK